MRFDINSPGPWHCCPQFWRLPSVVMHLCEHVKLFEYYLKEGEGEGILCNTH